MKPKYKSFLFTNILIVLIFTPVFAQVPAIEWQKAFGGSGGDIAYSVATTTDGGYVITGSSSSTNGDVTGNHGMNDFWVAKVDSNGTIQWQKSLGGSAEDIAYEIQQTTEGGYIVIGNTRSSNGDVTGRHGATDVWVVKLDAAGNLQWQHALGGFYDDFGRSIKQTTDGGYIGVGYTYSYDGDVTANHGEFDYWVFKLDASGNLIWQKTYGGSFLDEGNEIHQTTDGGYIIAGSSASNNGDVLSGNQGLRDYWVLKIDSLGNIQWEKSMGGSATEYCNSIAQTADGGYIVGGDTVSVNGDVTVNQGYTDFWVVKLNSNGQMEWQKTLGGSQNDTGNSIIENPNGGYTIAGYVESNDGDVNNNKGTRDCWIVNLDHNGNVLWQKAMGGSFIDSAESIMLTSDFGYIVAGYSLSSDGDVTNNHGGYDFWLVKLGPETLGIEDHNPNNFVAIYPTLATDHLKIRNNSDLNINSAIIYNLNGMSVFEIDFKNSKNHETIDISSLQTGTYFMKINSEHASIIKRFIKK